MSSISSLSPLGANAFYPVIKIGSIKIRDQNKNSRNSSDNNGCLVLPTTDTRPLYCKEIRSRHSTNRRNNQKGTKIHARKNQDIAEIIFRESRYNEKQKRDYCEEVEFFLDLFCYELLYQRSPKDAGKLKCDPRAQCEPVHLSITYQDAIAAL